MKTFISTISMLTIMFLFGMSAEAAPKLKVERSVKVSFDSELGKAYNAYSSTDVSKKKWKLMGGPVEGNGEKIVFFYQSDDDQKVFFKVDEVKSDDGNGERDKEEIDVADRWDQFLKDNKDKLYIFLVGLTSERADIQQLEMNDDGKMELQSAGISDATFRGNYSYQEGYDRDDFDGGNWAHTFNYKLFGQDVKYNIFYMPGLFAENKGDPYFYGTYILTTTIGNETATNERGNFWLQIKSDD